MANVFIRVCAVTVFCTLVTTTSARSLLENRLFEGELTALLREFLSPLDPATIEKARMPISVANTHLDLVIENAECTGFSLVDVTVFDPPLPLLSNQVKMVVVMESVTMDAANYNWTGVFLGNPVSGSGPAWLSMESLRYEVTFDADEFTTGPEVVICVQRGSFHLTIQVAAVTGEFQGLDLVNEHMDLVGPILFGQLQAYVNQYSDIMEDKLNAIFC